MSDAFKYSSFLTEKDFIESLVFFFFLFFFFYKFEFEFCLTAYQPLWVI